MQLPKFVLLAAILPLAWTWSCRSAEAQTVGTPTSLVSPPAWEEDADQPPMPKESQIEPGDLQPGIDPFPLKSMRVSTTISGTVAHVVVEQVFGNRNRKPINAVYLFPLPHQAAIHDLTIRTSGQTIRAKIQRKADARQTYEDAARQGKVAALLEQERPNLFQQSVANLMPGSELTVRTVMDMPVAFRGDETEFVFPTAVGPRFCPAGSVPDLGKIGAPRLPRGMEAPQKVDVDVRLDAGVAVTEISSPSHELTVAGKGEWNGPVTIGLRGGSVMPNKDFVLRWKARGARPLASVVMDQASGGHFLLQIQPPLLGGSEATSGKEIVFLVDQSGSMQGEPISKLKQAMRKALREMDPRDRFQIVGFSNVARPFAAAPVQATAAEILKGLAFIDGLDADGGTQMLDGIRQAFSYRPAPGVLRIVCLMTDGLIGDEQEILQAVEREMGDQTRVFSLGIGSSVNRWLLEEVAVRGRGKSGVATLDEDPSEAIEKFLENVRRPVMTGIELAWSGVEIVDQVPSRIPDLFDGEPLVVTGRILSGSVGSVVVRGESGGKKLRLEIPVDLAKGEKNGAVGSLWARSRIAEMERSNGGNPVPEVVESMTKLALQYRLASEYTSFVAVMEDRVNKSGKAVTVDVPLPLPEGVTESALGGGADRMVATAPSEGGTTEARSAAMPSMSPVAVMQSSVMDRMAAQEQTGNSNQNMTDVILAGGGGSMLKGDRSGSQGGVGLGQGGRQGFGSAYGVAKSGKARRASIAPPKPIDVELGGDVGMRSAESILRVIRQHMGGFRYSYEKALRTNPELGGKLSLKFTIAPSGDIVAIQVVSSSTGNAALDQEIMDKARRMKFDSIESGNVTVTYAFVLDKK